MREQRVTRGAKLARGVQGARLKSPRIRKDFVAKEKIKKIASGASQRRRATGAARSQTRERSAGSMIAEAQNPQGFPRSSIMYRRLTLVSSQVPSPPPRKLCASHVELYFNNMYLSRPDSFQLSLALQGRVLHVGQRVVLPGSGARLRVGDMYSAVASRGSSSRGGGGASTSSSAAGVEDGRNAPLDAAYISSSTKIVFRSESARHYVFVEVSSELWQFEEDGSMLLEKAELFLQELFSHYSGKMSKDAEDTRSKGIPTSHVLSIILYGRVIYDDKKDGEEERAPLQRLENGTMYRDFYKVRLSPLPLRPSRRIDINSSLPAGHPRPLPLPSHLHNPYRRARTPPLAIHGAPPHPPGRLRASQRPPRKRS